MLSAAQALVSPEVAFAIITLLVYIGFSNMLLSLSWHRLIECARILRNAGVGGRVPHSRCFLDP